MRKLIAFLFFAAAAIGQVVYPNNLLIGTPPNGLNGNCAVNSIAYIVPITSTFAQLVTCFNGNWSLGNGMYSQTNTTTVVNTTVETSVFGTGVGNNVVPANYCVPGKTFRVTIAGIHSAVSSPNLTLNLKFGGTTVATTGSFATHNSTNEGFFAQMFLTCRSSGVNGTLQAQGTYQENSGGIQGLTNITTSTINTTIANTIDFTVIWSTASTSNAWSATNVIVESIN